MTSVLALVGLLGESLSLANVRALLLLKYPIGAEVPALCGLYFMTLHRLRLAEVKQAIRPCLDFLGLFGPMNRALSPGDPAVVPPVRVNATVRLLGPVQLSGVSILVYLHPLL